jgi:predicted alpha/beta superfamily hydrolase
MKTRPIAIIALPLILAGFSPALAAKSAAPTFPPHAIANTELRVLPPAVNGRSYQLHISLPASYTKEPNRRYPVLYVTDGYWDFETVHASYMNLVYDRVAPECLIVGLGYAGENLDYNTLRGWELSPAPLGPDAKASGHAADFLKILEQTIMPFVAREYRTDPSYRVLAGSSLGGLFTLYTMYTKPELFQAYIAASPAVVVHDGWLFGYEEAFEKSNRPLKARLFVTAAENERPSFRAAIERFSQVVSSRHYPGFVFKFRLIDGERHGGTKSESYNRGLRFAFAPLAPESGPMKDRK